MSDEEGPTYTKGHQTHKSIKTHLEYDFQGLMNGPSGVFFRERIAQARLTPRLGGDDWWFDPELVDLFKHYITYNKRTGDLVLQVGPRKVQINADYISRITGLQRNPRYNDSTMNLFSTLALYNVSNRVEKIVLDFAPYHHPTHLRINQNRIRTKGLQENQSLVAKWFIMNFLGTQLYHLADCRTV